MSWRFVRCGPSLTLRRWNWPDAVIARFGHRIRHSCPVGPIHAITLELPHAKSPAFLLTLQLAFSEPLMMRLSTVIPVFNRQTLAERALRSVLNNTSRMLRSLSSMIARNRRSNSF